MTSLRHRLMTVPHRLRRLRQRLAAADTRAQEGSAIVEFAYHGRVKALAEAAREAGRAFVTAASEDSASGRAQAAAAIAFTDQGFTGDQATLAIACAASPCFTPEAKVEMSTTVTVPLPLIPSFARDVIPLEVPVSATQVVTIDRFRG